jgi:translation elongation factor EF-1alpha
MIQGPTTGIIEQEIGSIEIEHEKKDCAEKGQIVALKINENKKARKNDKVYVIVSC